MLSKEELEKRICQIESLLKEIWQNGEQDFIDVQQLQLDLENYRAQKNNLK
ncbi:hypothetical protein bcgnr5378_37060 [Bacillus cereus]|uniref:Uncharacterized protein n=1 Tax=Bacillus cereus TaxID=1396 RepID=A0A164QNU5_BACCE|nr:hypothetical protein [Bacillus cereus]KZD71963.1 hypothetical protein B4088_0424 [Bacillus cereus]HDR8328637.1 hypothetical protein [Bacillus cereus]